MGKISDFPERVIAITAAPSFNNFLVRPRPIPSITNWEFDTLNFGICSLTEL